MDDEPALTSRSPISDVAITPNRRSEVTATSQTSGKLKTDPTLLLFVVQLALNGANASAAAREVGWSEEKLRRTVSQMPELRDLVQHAVAQFAGAQLTEWQQMHGAARATIFANLSSDDDRVRQSAAEYIVERVEGKTPLVVRDDTPRVSMDAVEMRFVSNLYLLKGMPVAEALAFARAHPDEVQAWGQARGLISGGGAALPPLPQLVHSRLRRRELHVRQTLRLHPLVQV
jgi:hypothetical protein